MSRMKWSLFFSNVRDFYRWIRSRWFLFRRCMRWLWHLNSDTAFLVIASAISHLTTRDLRIIRQHIDTVLDRLEE